MTEWNYCSKSIKTNEDPFSSTFLTTEDMIRYRVDGDDVIVQTTHVIYSLKDEVPADEMIRLLTECVNDKKWADVAVLAYDVDTGIVRHEILGYKNTKAKKVVEVAKRDMEFRDKKQKS